MGRVRFIFLSLPFFCCMCSEIGYSEVLPISQFIPTAMVQQLGQHLVTLGLITNSKLGVLEHKGIGYAGCRSWNGDLESKHSNGNLWF